MGPWAWAAAGSPSPAGGAGEAVSALVPWSLCCDGCHSSLGRMRGAGPCPAGLSSHRRPLAFPGMRTHLPARFSSGGLQSTYVVMAVSRRPCKSRVLGETGEPCSSLLSDPAELPCSIACWCQRFSGHDLCDCLAAGRLHGDGWGRSFPRHPHPSGGVAPGYPSQPCPSWLVDGLPSGPWRGGCPWACRSSVIRLVPGFLEGC